MKPLTQSALQQGIAKSNGGTQASTRLVNAISNRLRRQRQRLLRLRETLLEEIHQLRSEASEENPNYSMHPADAGTDSFDRDLVLGLASFKQEGLYEIDAALERIDDGTYGCMRVDRAAYTLEEIGSHSLDAVFAGSRETN